MSTFLIADDHPLFREALQAGLSPFFDDLEIIEADCLSTTLKAIKNHPKINLILLDLSMPGSDNYYGLTSVIEKSPNTPVIVVTASDSEESVNIAMHYGARGYIPKTYNSRKMAHAIMTVLDGGKFIPEKYIDKIGINDPELITSIELVKGLTPKQLRVLKCLKEGKMNKQIADELFVTEATVKAHISAIFKKFNVTSRTQVVLLIDNIDLTE
ncbi:MAG: response regulator transcription factor [Glaciecola sp.]|nr:response regulator transcription factor [Glaciecola sp.]MDG1814729.1 response regulator transcription factor [Glaciecola sp.]MDG2100423.1 response regulator transcription factor [Glaciecola sp.]